MFSWNHKWQLVKIWRSEVKVTVPRQNPYKSWYILTLTEFVGLTKHVIVILNVILKIVFKAFLQILTIRHLDLDMTSYESGEKTVFDWNCAGWQRHTTAGR